MRFDQFLTGSGNVCFDSLEIRKFRGKVHPNLFLTLNSESHVTQTKTLTLLNNLLLQIGSKALRMLKQNSRK